MPAPTQDPAPTPAPDEPQTPVQDTVAPTLVHEPADTNAPTGDPNAPNYIGGPSALTTPERDQAIGASLGAAIGGRTTPGGLRIAGSYLYKLAHYRESRSQDWFDGTVAFTFGSGAADCFRDRMDNVICDHGLADGYSVEISANVQHLFRQRYIRSNMYISPFVRGGIGVGLVRFADDDITGVSFPLHLGAGIRVLFGDTFAIIGQADFAIGIAAFNIGPGAEPQLGLNVTGGVEFRL
jgi:hypothetical protein